jgi:hypothetical protein
MEYEDAIIFSAIGVAYRLLVRQLMDAWRYLSTDNISETLKRFSAG